MSDTKNTLIDQLNAELLSDVQKLHNELIEVKKEMSDLDRINKDIALSSEGVKQNIINTMEQFEIMAKGIILFAKDERSKIETDQKNSQKEIIDKFFMLLKKNNETIKIQFSFILTTMAVIVILLIMIICGLFFIATK